MLALVSLILHNSMRLHVFQCFHCVESDNVHKTRFWREITRFSIVNVFFAENAFKRGEKLFLALVSLLWHNSMRLHVSQCIHCVKNDNLQKMAFLARNNAF